MKPTDRYGVHQRRDEERLEIHLRVAERLRGDASVIEDALTNLDRWEATRGPHRYYDEWRRILREESVQDIIARITSDSAEGRRLRQSSPFVGIIPAEERDEILRGS